ncbi:cellulase family glycosylhydrolase [Demequina sediminicola]|uniref:cellulase family glycosylhydrolase n=1 Tax=Demequina sediminicola TaxID=1095026 RepID=UPI0007811C97|nr:cellulase family glycosylhydrolase [Demequina sediminicola]
MSESDTTEWWRQPRVIIPGAAGAALLLVAGGWFLGRVMNSESDGETRAVDASPSAAVSSEPTSSPTLVPACSAKVDVTAEWDGGYQADITVKAEGIDIPDWEVAFDLGDSSVTGAWNSTLKVGTTGTATAANVSYNGTLTADETTVFGFTADGEPTIGDATCASSVQAEAEPNDSADAAADPADVSAPVNAASGDDWLSVDGNSLVDAQGNHVWLTGANWFGFNTSERVLHGLWSVNLEDTMAAYAQHGLNVIRIPISTEVLMEWRAGNAETTTNVNTSANPELEGFTTLEVFDEFLAISKKYGVKVILDVHSAEADNAGHIAPLWHTASVSEDDFFVAWEWVAERYRNDDTIIAFDLQNEPHGKPPEADRATWGDGGANDWRAVATEAAERIHAIHPDILLLVEGIEATPSSGSSWSSNDPGDYDITWWGGNLRLAGEQPVTGAPGKIMYSPHDYGPLVYEQPWFQGSFSAASLEKDVWDPTWLYLHDEEISPLLIGEWGGRMGDDDRQDRWLVALRDLIEDRELHHTFWSLNPNSGDTGGLLLDDWTTWDADKMDLLEPVLWRDASGAGVSLDHQIPLGSSGVSLGEYYS